MTVFVSGGPRSMRHKSALLLTVSYLAFQAWPAGQLGAVSLNNNVAADTDEAANIYDSANTLYPNVVNVGGCTGTLINSRTILTAAHCFTDGQTPFPSSINIRFNPDISNPSRFDQMAVGLNVEPNYRDAVTGNDIAVVT